MINLIKSHRTVRKYKNEPISNETFNELIHAAQHASSSNFLQAYSVIKVSDPIKIKSLGELSNNQLQFNTAALSLVFCADLNRAEQATDIHDININYGTLEKFIVSIIDTALFAQNFALAAESKDFGVCYIGGVRNNPEKISELLSIPERVIPLFGMTMGIPDEQNELKPRLPLDAIVHQDSYDEHKNIKYIKEYDEIMKNYYEKRSKNNKNLNWSKSLIKTMSNKDRTHLNEFVKSKGFLDNP